MLMVYTLLSARRLMLCFLLRQDLWAAGFGRNYTSHRSAPQRKTNIYILYVCVCVCVCVSEFVVGFPVSQASRCFPPYVVIGFQKRIYWPPSSVKIGQATGQLHWEKTCVWGGERERESSSWISLSQQLADVSLPALWLVFKSRFIDPRFGENRTNHGSALQRKKKT